VVAALSDLPHQKIFGSFFSSCESQFRELVGPLVKSSKSFGQKQQELSSKAARAMELE